MKAEENPDYEPEAGAGDNAEHKPRGEGRKRHHRSSHQDKHSESGKKYKKRKNRNPQHRAGRKHKRLYRAERDPHIKLHRSLDDSHFRFDSTASRESAIAGVPPRPRK